MEIWVYQEDYFSMKRTRFYIAVLAALILCMAGLFPETEEHVPANLSGDGSSMSEIRAEIPEERGEHTAAAEPLIHTDEEKKDHIRGEDGRDGGAGTVSDAPSDLQPETAPVLIKETETQKDPDIPAAGATPEEHRHQWVDKIVAHHEAVTHTEHHDAVTEQRWVSVPETVNHYYCDVCRMEFFTQEDAYAHEDATMEAAIEAGDMSLVHSGHTIIPETVDNGYWETVTVQEAYEETITDEPAWDEHCFVCTLCGATG